MTLDLEYCGAWNYLPRAASLAEKIKNQLSLETNIIRGSGGVFEITLNGQLLYSKKATGEFPSDAQAIELIKAKL